MQTNSSRKYVEGEVLVRFRHNSTASARSALHTSIRASVAKRFHSIENLELVALPRGVAVHDALRRYRSDPSVLYAEPNYYVQALGEPSDPGYPQQWHLSNTGQLGGGIVGADIHALQAWQLTTGNSNAVIMTIDSGVDYFHPDLSTNTFHNTPDCNFNGVDDDGDGYVDDCYGINVVKHDSDPMDDLGHGTHVAGLIGAAGNNAIGVVGVNWNVQIVACKFLDSYGAGSVAGAVECLNYAKTLKSKGVNIVATNNSWGQTEYSQALVDAINAQRQAGILFIAAAGNDFSDNDAAAVYPANIPLPNVIAVAATTNSDGFALFSNVGKHTVHISAPGQELLSTLPGGSYGPLSGTSMAAPLVTGVAALLAAQNPDMTWQEIKNRILAGGDQVADLQSTVTGRRLNAYGALTCSDKPVLSRLLPMQNANAAAVGSPVLISYLNINCSHPGNPLTATVSTGEVISLKDDGTGADATANDGVFTGTWTPTSTGSYTIALPDGDNISVQVLTRYNPVQEVMNYRQISGTSLNLSDDSVASFTSPFPINFGAGSFNQVYVGSNGTISFTNPFDSFYNLVLPLGADSILSTVWNDSAVTLLAPLWDDLYPVPDTDQNVFWDVTGTTPNRELVIEWRNVRLFDCRNDPTKTYTFQVVLKESDSSVLYQYQNLQSGCKVLYDHDFGASATVGLQIAPKIGTTWVYGDTGYPGTLANGTAIHWQLVTVPIPDNPVPVITGVSPNQVAADSPATTVTITGTNFVPGSYVIWDSNLGIGFEDKLLTNYKSPTELTATINAWDLSAPFTGRHQITVVNPAPAGGQSNVAVFGVGIAPAIITSISPTSAVGGGPDFTLTVNGTGFGDNSLGIWVQVFWNGNGLSTKWISSTQMQATVPAAYIANAGTANVYAYVNGWGNTNSLSFTITSGNTATTTFVKTDGQDKGAAPKPYRFLGWGYTEKAGSDYLKRFSRDFHSPYASASTSTANTGVQTPQSNLPSLPFGTPLPGLGLRPTLPTGYIPTAVATGDFNGDGKLDWAIANGGDNSIWIYMGRGDGSWDLPQIIHLRGLSPVAIIATDLRSRRVLDLVVAETDSMTIGVLTGNGNGTFADEDEYSTPAPPTYLCAGDFNKDGAQDVLVGTLGTLAKGALYMMQGDQTGRLSSPVSLPNQKRYPYTAPSAWWLAVGDWDRDGFVDAVVSEPYADPTSEAGVLAYQNSKDGSFKEEFWIRDNFFMETYAVAAGDINEDGCLDVLVSTGGSTSAYLGHCDGTFTSGADPIIGVGDYSFGIKLADVNGDGHLDLIAAGVFIGGGQNWGNGADSGTLVSVALGNGDGSFRRPRVYRGEASAFMFDVGDVNGDGKLDIITANQDSDSASLFLNLGNGDFGTPSGDYVGYQTDGSGGTINSPFSAPVATNITGTLPDIAYLEAERWSGSPYNITVLPNLGGNKFGAPLRTPLLTSPLYFYDLLFADFRAMGRSDFLGLKSSINGESESYVFVPSNSDGTFGTPSVVQTSTSWGALGAGDFNGDGKLDFVIADMTTTGLRLSPYMGNNNGTFTTMAASTLTGSFTTRVNGVFVGDFNKDGKADVLVWLVDNLAGSKVHDVYEFLGNGDGTFAPAKRVLQNVDPFRLVDLNRDGYMDVVEFTTGLADYPNVSTPLVRVYMGQPDGSFTLKSTYQPYTGIPLRVEVSATVVSHTASSRVADFDGDGYPDIALFQETKPGLTTHDGYVNFLKGNGDGTFTPLYATHRLETNFAPILAADFNGDGKTELFDMVGFSSSYDIIPTERGPEFQLSLVADPVVGQQGTLRITMNAPSTTPVALSLKSSASAVSVPSSVTVPAGTNFLDVPFQLAQDFDNSHVFSITASSSDQNQTLYGTQLQKGAAGFAVSLQYSPSNAILQGETASYNVVVVSLNGWKGPVTATCSGLPAGANCSLTSPVEVPSGGSVNINLQVTTTASVAQGKYNFVVTVSDGTNNETITLQFVVGEVTLEVTPSSGTTLSTGSTGFRVDVNATLGIWELFDLQCTGLPATARCYGTVAWTGTPGIVGVSTNNTPVGNYPFTIVGTNSLGSSRSATTTLRVVDVTASFSATTGSLKVGQSTNTTLTLSAPNGFDEQVTISAVPSSNDVTVALSPSTVGFASTADSKSLQITFTANAVTRASGPLYREHSPYRGFRFGAIAGVLAVGLILGRRGGMRASATTLMIVTLAMLLSCGGGGGGSSTSPPPPPPPPPTPTSETVTVTFFLSSSSNSIMYRNIGTISLTVTQ